jgi:S1-C subfamily serine protease
MNDRDDLLQMANSHAIPRLDRVTAFFPDGKEPVVLFGDAVSEEEDLGAIRFDASKIDVPPLVLADAKPKAGERVIVIGYPYGLNTLVAKATPAVASQISTQGTSGAFELAKLHLVHPTSTHGSLGDVVGTRMSYDAPTAPGSSGSPVLNSRGEVIGISVAIISNFPAGNFGISTAALKHFMATLKKDSIPTESGN